MSDTQQILQLLRWIMVIDTVAFSTAVGMVVVLLVRRKDPASSEAKVISTYKQGFDDGGSAGYIEGITAGQHMWQDENLRLKDKISKMEKGPIIRQPHDFPSWPETVGEVERVREIMRLGDELDAARKGWQTATDERNDLRVELSGAKTRLRGLERVLESVRDEYTKQKAELDQAKEAQPYKAPDINLILAQQLADAQAAVENWMAQTAAAEKEVGSLQQRLNETVKVKQEVLDRMDKVEEMNHNQVQRIVSDSQELVSLRKALTEQQVINAGALRDKEQVAITLREAQKVWFDGKAEWQKLIKEANEQRDAAQRRVDKLLVMLKDLGVTPNV